jgi:hypothetical protein
MPRSHVGFINPANVLHLKFWDDLSFDEKVTSSHALARELLLDGGRSGQAPHFPATLGEHRLFGCILPMLGEEIVQNSWGRKPITSLVLRSSHPIQIENTRMK